jgi:3-hydroxymyristoyl/3-hydroxydecanoyl-(acyl carrier protein) dehydratase
MTDREFFWTVPTDHPAFAGHFPGHAILPGVVILDHVLRCAGELQGGIDACWQVNTAKFFSPVGPGEALTFSLQPRPSGRIAFAVRAGTRDVALGNLAAYA